MRPRLLDLFCGAGGCSVGYAQAGFDVLGVDINPQPRYPFEFHRVDARAFPLAGFDVIHASPPCQAYSAGAAKWKTQGNHPDLIALIRYRLLLTGLPYVIENIEPARKLLRSPVMLCGTMFDLGVYRHRYFETNVRLPQRLHQSPHPGHVGDGQYFTVTGHTGGSSRRDGWQGGTTADWQRAMGIDWMTAKELKEAIPPAYTQWLGTELLAGIAQSGRAAVL